MWQAERQNLIHRLRFDRNITISHLLFTNDSLIFARASVDDCKQLKKVFYCYALASRQVFNYEKSFMFFSGKIPEGQTTTIKDIFQLNIVSRHEKYLRLPSIVGRKRTSFFNNVKLKVLSKISNQQHKLFSSGGKKTLIKAVAEAVPAYAISVFKIPTGLCNDIHRAIARFSQGSKEDNKGIHWEKQEKISYAKIRGGLVSKIFQALIKFQLQSKDEGCCKIQIPQQQRC